MWAIVLVVGTVLAGLGANPVAAVIFAPANGVLLPIIAVFLLFVMNRSDLLGEFKNGTVGNILGGIIVLFAAFLGVRTILLAFGIIG